MNKKNAEDVLAAARADILRGEYKLKKDRKIRFEDFAEEYLEYSKANKRSWRRDISSLNNLKPFFGNMLLQKITSREIEKYKKERLKHIKQKVFLEKKERSGKKQPAQEKKEKPKLIKPATVNRELAFLKNMFTQAIKFDENPVKDVRTAFNAALSRAGIRDVRFHDLWHTAATLMIMGGVDLVTVKEIFGHASIETTMRHAHPTPARRTMIFSL